MLALSALLANSNAKVNASAIAIVSTASAVSTADNAMVATSLKPHTYNLGPLRLSLLALLPLLALLAAIIHTITMTC